MQPMLSAQTRKGGAGSLEEYTDLYQLLSKDYEANVELQYMLDRRASKSK